MTEVWPEIQGDNRCSTNACSWGIPPSVGPNISSPFLYSQEARAFTQQWHSQYLTTGMLRCRSIKKPRLLQFWAGSWRPLFWILGKLGGVRWKGCPWGRGRAERVEEDGYCRAGGWVVGTVSVHQFELIFQNVTQILTSCVAIPGHSRLFYSNTSCILCASVCTAS